jgi:Raf kinase inhibitor-like YbhB/YbcL family protein
VNYKCDVHLIENFMDKFKLISPNFKNEGYIPSIFTCDGENISPTLTWKDAPKETISFVLIMEDPDTSKGVWYHWIVFNIPAHLHKITEAVEQLPEGIKLGKNSWGNLNYEGPCPPPMGEHRYFFNLYALDCLLPLDSGITYQSIKENMEGHILARAQLMARYERGYDWL